MTKTIKVLFIAAWVLAASLVEIRAQMFSVKAYKLSVKGTSSLHDWESTVDKLEATGSFLLQNNRLSDIGDVIVRIPVKAIKGPKGKLMDNKTWNAFNHEKHPTITFVLTDRKIEAAKNTLIANGTLSMAGVTKPVELHLLYKVLPKGELQISGKHTVRMSDFEMEPPTAMMGAIKVSDDVVVDFEITLNATGTL